MYLAPPPYKKIRMAQRYISYCKPPQDVQYQCDGKTVTRLRTPVKTSTAYLLFCDSVHADIWDISLVPVVHLLMVWWWPSGLMSAWYLWDVRCWVGEVEYWCSSCDVGWMMCGLCGGQWAVEVIWTYPIISCTPSDPIFPKVPSHYFPYPFWSHSSQRALLNAYALMALCWGRCLLLFHVLGIVLLYRNAPDPFGRVF